VVDGVQNGTVEMAHTAPYYFFGKDEALPWRCVPFGMNSPDEGLDGRWQRPKLMREFYAKYNIVNFLAATPAPRWAAGSARKSSP
jgi:TRAP-type mannitol/chloroaromatic compound transport system substrate-binding protein